MQKFQLEDSSASLFIYNRRETSPVKVGNIEIGGDNPVRIQSMANTDTNDTANSVEQAIRIENAGGELVRFTAQGVKEANNLRTIHDELRRRRSNVPLVADIHFNPSAAFAAAENVEKVRINPGNFVDKVHTRQRFDYTDEEYSAEIGKIKEKFYPLLDICKKNNTAIRVGVNHGSLSDRILSRYGDTPKGMVESCMEFLRLAVAYDFYRIVISIKASNPVIMVQTVRLLIATMEKEKMKFPLHLGVTEAGDGEDGRVKSAVGIGALLQEGIGDTIRVSLSEAPENEIPVARKLVDYISLTAPVRSNASDVVSKVAKCFDPYSYRRRETVEVANVGGAKVPVVVSNRRTNGESEYDYYCENGVLISDIDEISPSNSFVSNDDAKYISANIHEYESVKNKIDDRTIIVLDSYGFPISQDGIGGQREFFHKLLNDGVKNPVIIRRRYLDDNLEDLQIKAGADFGQFFIDGFGDGIWVDAPNLPQEKVNSVMFAILQAVRVRISKTEYISCPSCGRTLFHLESTISKIKASTSHLKGLKIGIMGCIVNGPGEMADADYGYVGAGKGRVNLYKKQECVEKAIPEEDAVEHLIRLIKENGDWVDA